MTGRLLDMGKMPREQRYACADGTTINIRQLLADHHSVVKTLMVDGLVKWGDSFGFAMAAPTSLDELSTRNSQENLWDYPDEFVWFTGGWGPHAQDYAANAIRKMRPALRVFADYAWDGVAVGWLPGTLEMRFHTPHHFRDQVSSTNADGTYPWGDFPYGGAAYVQMGDLLLLGAVSGLKEIEDDFIAKLILGGLGKLIVNGDGLLPKA